MPNESLATYLNDHLAGSVVALQLLDHLAEDGAGTAEASLLADVHADIEADQQELEAFMARLGIAVSAPKKATGWLVEKLSELKLHLDDAGDGALRRLEALETDLPRHRRESRHSGTPWPRRRRRRRSCTGSTMRAWDGGRRRSVGWWSACGSTPPKRRSGTRS